MARLVPNTDDTTTNTLYIQGDGGVIANYNSSYLFCDFSKLTEIENINLLDTSKVTNMSFMFSYCKSLTSLDFRNATFDKVNSYDNMFNSTPSTINIITKDATTKAWLEDKLGGSGTVVIA